MQQPAGVVVRPAIKHVPRSVVRDAHERIVRCGLGIVPVSSETEDKFEDAMEVMASSPLPELACVIVCLDHVVRFISRKYPGIPELSIPVFCRSAYSSSMPNLWTARKYLARLRL